MAKFVQDSSGEIYRILLDADGGMWIISFSNPAPPVFIASAEEFQLVEIPFDFLKATKRILKKAEIRRKVLIQPLLDMGGQCITDKAYRLQMSRNIAEMTGTTARQILRIFYRYLATGSLERSEVKALKRLQAQRRKIAEQRKTAAVHT